MHRFHWQAGTLALVLSFIGIAAVCPLVGASQEITFRTPEELAARLKQGSRDRQSQLAKLLRLHSYSQQSGFDECEVRVIKASLKAEAITSLIEVHCKSYDVDLVVLEQADGEWHWLDTVPLWAVYDRLTVELASLVQPPVQEIIVHKNCTAHGTGIYYGHFLVLKLIEGHLRLIFNAMEQATEAPYDAPPRKQTSTFKLIPASKREAAGIEEIAQYQYGQRVYTVKRLFTWDERLKTFVTEVIDNVESTRQPAKDR